MSDRVAKLESALTCPDCGTVKMETMPANACWYFYDCSGCGTVLKPKPGDCCSSALLGQLHARLSNLMERQLIVPVFLVQFRSQTAFDPGITTGRKEALELMRRKMSLTLRRA